MNYNFDEIIDRKGTSAYKTDLCVWRFGTDDVLPLWVADMDFKTPDFVMNAIRERCTHELLGYTIRNKEFYLPIINWIEYKHNWRVDSKWLGFIPGVVMGMAIAVHAFTQKGDKIIIQPPVYPPFFSVVEDNQRELVLNQLIFENGQYRINFDELRALVADPQVKMLLFCSPHNPGGRVWDREELKELAQICSENGVIVLSDEIHADLVLPGYTHIPFATVSEEAKNNSMTLMAPSKTFNIPGLGSSTYIIPNPDLYKTYSRQVQALEVGTGNIFSYVATTAAYENGANWLNQLISYVQGNIDYVDDFLKQHLPKIKAVRPQASFLIWLDFSALNMSDEQLQDLLVKQAKLGLNPGPSFGSGGSGFNRLNVGCSRLVLKDAMDRLQKTFKNF
jgi:cystathionine beta-lyase